MEWLGVIMGAGGVAFVGALFAGLKQVWESWNSSRTRQLRDLEKWRADAMAEAEFFRELAGIRAAREATLAYEMTRAGMTLPNLPAIPVRPPREEPTP